MKQAIGYRLSWRSAGMFRACDQAPVLLVLLAACLLSLSVAAASLQAATIIVSNTNDDGPGSLRAALRNTADGDTIDATGVAGTIFLTSGELVVDKCVTILGPGPDALAVDGNAADRVFNVTNAITAAISNLTITNGSATASSFPPYAGGAIYIDRSTLTVSNCTLSGNSATSGFGGSMFNNAREGSATLTVLDSTVNSNAAGWGGGIFNDGVLGRATLNVVNSTLSGNLASAFGVGTGGGIVNAGRFGSATLTVRNSTLSCNSASNGGGIYNDGGEGSATLLVVNSIISSNSASFVGGGSGGGIYNGGAFGSATLTVLNSALSANTAGDSGGSIFNDGRFFGSARLAVSACTLSRNSAGSGGGINNGGCCQGSATLTIVNCTVSGNSATLSGGVYNDARFDGSAVLDIANSTFSGNTADAGGVIYNDGSFAGIAILETGNTALNAGATSGTITNNYGTVTSHGYNISSDDGGGFLIATGDRINTNPRLGPLQDNGGPTFTHALLTGSPAINAGDPAFDPNTFDPPLVYDQRGPGFMRVVSGRIDIGAFEFQGDVGECSTISDLIEQVEATDLNHGLKNSLVRKLNAAQASMDRGRDRAARNQLRAFMNHVRALKRVELLDPTAADALTDCAQTLSDSMRRPSERK